MLHSLENKVQLEYNIVMNCLEHAVTCYVAPHSQHCLPNYRLKTLQLAVAYYAHE